MKNLKFVLCVGILLFSGCINSVTETGTYMINEPVFMSADDFRESVNVTTRAIPISDYGKICFYEDFIYISATGKGIHIIDNRNPASPQNVGFIEMMGNADLAIRNGKLYADANIDLVWFDISNPAMPKLDGRLENVFAQHMPLPPTDNDYPIDYTLCYNTNGSKGVITGWKVKQRAYHEETRLKNNGAKDDIKNLQKEMSNGPSGSNGINGSMSRFALYKDYLYTVINDYMTIIDLSGAKPVKAAENIPIGWNVETLFSYKDNMFMGTPTGMLIYSVANPLKPEFVSSVSHVYGCDPVVVEDDIAYVTIHSGNSCGQNTNELIVYDVSNVRNPKHLVSYAMTKPKGLGIDSGTLFICDDGLKIFDAENPQTIMANQLAHYSGMEGFDVIPFSNTLMMIAEDGLYQYDYSDLSNIKELSKLPITRR